MRRDKKLAQRKKHREQVRKQQNSRPSFRGLEELARLASAGGYGPAYLSAEWRDDSLPPRLVTAVVSRTLPNGLFFAHAMLLDRTCLGVKNALSRGPLTSTELAHFIELASTPHPDGLEQLDPMLVQSVVYAAVEYAADLGFHPNVDFDARLVGPRPTALLPSPLARRTRPFYTPGPDDDIEAVLAQLDDAVGPDGYDPSMGLAEENDLGAPPDVPLLHTPDEAALHEALQRWLAIARNDSRFDILAAIGAYIHAVNGEAPRSGATFDQEHMSSLPFFWNALFRPLDKAPSARTGLDLAFGSKPMAPHRVALEQLHDTRATLFDVIDVEPTRDVAVCRDVFDGRTLEVRMDAQTLSRTTRWTRFFGYLTPMRDGSWYPPSALLGHAWLRNTEPARVIDELNQLLQEMGIDERVDSADPSSGLLRFGALMHGVLFRSIKPAEEQQTDAPIYCVNTDDERYEPHEALLTPGVRRTTKLVKLLRTQHDFVEDDFGFGWVAKPRGKQVFEQEQVGHVREEDDRTLLISANSAPRFARLLARLAALVDAPLKPVDLEISRPWELDAKFLAEERPGCQKVVAASSSIAHDSVPEALLDLTRRQLDEDIPTLGGRPRDLVKDAEGQRNVERWLMEQELRGGPDRELAFLDLDVLRRELGMPTVR